MAYIQKYSVSVTTAADGSATAYSAVIPHGLIEHIRYIKTDFADGSTITFTVDGTGEAVWAESSVNASATRAPRQATHGATGTALVYASTDAVADKIAVSADRIKIVVASGGNAKTGTFHIYVS